MELIKIILFRLLLFIPVIAAAQNNNYYYTGDRWVRSEEGLNAEKNKDKSLRDKKLIFVANKIVERNDSILHYGKLWMVNKEYKEDKITNHLNKPLPEMSLERYTGGQFVSMHLDSKPTLIAIFYVSNLKSRWMDELPQLNAFEEKYRGKVNFIAITKQDRTKVTQLLLNAPFKYTILINGKNYLDKLDSWCSPKLMLIDKNGIIKYISSGMIPVVDSPEENKKTVDNFMNEIDQLLK